MGYITKNGIRIDTDNIYVARLLASNISGCSQGFDLSEFRRICFAKGVIENDTTGFEGFSRFDTLAPNNFVEAYSLTCFGNRFDRFSYTFEFFLQHETKILGDPDTPRFFNIFGSIFSDTEILISFEILQGKKKYRIDDEVLSFISKSPHVEEIDQKYITVDYLLGQHDYFRAIKKAMQSMGKKKAIRYAANAYFNKDIYDEDFDDDFF